MIGGTASAPAPAVVSAYPTTAELDAMTKDELLAVGQMHELDVTSAMLKADIRAVIDTARGA